MQCPRKEKQVLLGLLTELVWPGWEEKGAGDQPGRDESGKSSRASGGSCGGLTQACRWSLGLNLGMHRGGNCRHRHV